MKLLFKIITLSTLLIGASTFGQKTTLHYEPAKAVEKQYKALYVIDEAQDEKIKMTIRNINNALEDPRLKGKLKVELLAFGAGVEMYKKTNPYEKLLSGLIDKGVVLVQCENTLRERKINKSELFDFVNYTPSGNGEIILREYEHWAVVKP